MLQGKTSLGFITVAISTPPTPGQLFITRPYAGFLTSLELKQVDLVLFFVVRTLN